MDGSGVERLGEAASFLPGGCPHCQGTLLQRWGMTARGLARLRCRGCRRTFSPETGALASGLRLRAAFDTVFKDMLGAEPSSCRRLGKRLGVHHMTVWRWRIRVLARVARVLPVSSGQGDGTVRARESRKASREWVNHARWPELFPAPPRPRWRDLRPGEAPPGGWAAWRVQVRIALPGQSLAGGPQRRFDRFLAPFRGPATRYLQGYAAWMVVREAVRGPAGPA